MESLPVKSPRRSSLVTTTSSSLTRMVTALRSTRVTWENCQYRTCPEARPGRDASPCRSRRGPSVFHPDRNVPGCARGVELRVAETWRPHESRRTVRRANAFLGDAEHAGVELAVVVLIVKAGDRI